MRLDLDDNQSALLRELLDEANRDLRYQIADTNNSKFKAQLRERRDQVVLILDMVGGPLADT